MQRQLRRTERSEIVLAGRVDFCFTRGAIISILKRRFSSAIAAKVAFNDKARHPSKLAVANVPAFASKSAASGVSSSVSNKKSAKLTLWPLVAATFFMVSGGTYGIEDIVHGAGYGRAILIFLFTPCSGACPPHT